MRNQPREDGAVTNMAVAKRGVDQEAVFLKVKVKVRVFFDFRYGRAHVAKQHVLTRAMMAIRPGLFQLCIQLCVEFEYLRYIAVKQRLV